MGGDVGKMEAANHGCHADIMIKPRPHGGAPNQQTHCPNSVPDLGRVRQLIAGRPSPLLGRSAERPKQPMPVNFKTSSV